ncbi:PP2C family protein-serine/threonine phosphatase [Nocardioides sp. T2.26MG-1]|uniref:PP2C family protein-serine/threonine phosphatase n=1 Tax=Nocardioides sp. T2.26MG-1 TaxID=3041166 RepID=UPI002477ABE2|nr:PP2C family protein-serine/threonine phosphatase [Nocardioides sp. T2.26MG-1]CAI9417534.1 Phosphoserine phosphatase RsbU [Nocardioides sp. T2.26MG-1]
MTPFSAGRRHLDLGVVSGLAVLAVLVILSLTTDVQLIAVFAAGTIVASLLTTPRRTTDVAIAALLAAVGAGVWHGSLGTLDWAVRVLLCALLSLVGIQGAALRERREGRLERMTVIAETAQRAVLRAMPTAIGSVGLAARYVSATAEALVGGDLYEVAATPFGVRVIVGDVRGKGLEAVQTAAAVLGAFRAAAFTAPDIAVLARTIDETLARMIGDEEFVTAIVGEFHGDRVTLANCGHHPPLLVVGAEVETADTGEPALPLGLGAEPMLTEHPWPVGARVLFYTDGLVEARDGHGEFFPLDEYAAELGEGSVEEALDRLVERLLAWGGHRMSDDLALVLAESEQR